MTTHNDLPSDCEPDLPCDIREAFAGYVEARNRYRDAKVIELAPHRIAKQQTDHDLAHALARAFRSMDAARSYPPKEPA
jgi:hypothetical protein